MSLEPGPISERPSATLFDNWVAAAAMAESPRRVNTARAGIPPKVPLPSRKAVSTGSLLRLMHVHVSDHEQMGQLHQLLKYSREAMWHYLNATIFPATMKCVAPCGMPVLSVLSFLLARSSGTKAPSSPRVAVIWVVPCCSGLGLGSVGLRPTCCPLACTSFWNPSPPRRSLTFCLDRTCALPVVAAWLHALRVLCPCLCDFRENVEVELLSKWSVDGMLRSIATHEPPFSCLIDSGAMITGYSNHDVAKALLRMGLSGMDGCVFIDDNDNHMVVMRKRGSGGGTDGNDDFSAPVPLHQCGLSVHKRFTFYDQVHATGTDIKQAPGAVAVVTLSKDMTLRDCTWMNQCRPMLCTHVWVLK